MKDIFENFGIPPLVLTKNSNIWVKLRGKKLKDNYIYIKLTLFKIYEYKYKNNENKR
jgi:hypothetical protein